MISRLQLVIVAALAPGFLIGCGTPIKYDLDTPAQILAPIAAADIADGRARFRQLFCERLAAQSGPDAPCDLHLNRLGDEPDPSPSRPDRRLARGEMRVFIIPGYLGDAAPAGMMPFGASVDPLRSRGFQIDYLQVSGGGSSDHNAKQIAEQIEQLELSDDQRIILIGYSKGTIDLLHFLVYYPDLAKEIDGVVSIAGAVNGSPLADELPEKLSKTFGKLSGGDMGDSGGLESLRRSVQLDWMAHHPLPSDPEYFSLGSFTDRKNISSIMLGLYDRLALVEPRNDGQTIFYDQILPVGTLLGYANCDHWAVALPFQQQAKIFAATLMERNDYPRTVLLEAILTYLQEALANE